MTVMNDVNVTPKNKSKIVTGKARPHLSDRLSRYLISDVKSLIGRTDRRRQSRLVGFR